MNLGAQLSRLFEHGRPTNLQTAGYLMRLLLIEDDRRIASFLRKGLTEGGYAVDVNYDGCSGLLAAETEPYDLVIVDWMLPKLDGLTVCKEIRKGPRKVPILFLTARDSTIDKVSGLDAGADDYLTKPFSFSELLARIRALLRRGSEPIEKFEIDDLRLNVAERTATRGDERLELSSKEFSILEYFMRNEGRLVSRSVLTEHIWNINYDCGSNVVDVYVSYLRKKLDCGSRKPLLHTVRGAGYILRKPEE